MKIDAIESYEDSPQSIWRNPKNAFYPQSFGIWWTLGMEMTIMAGTFTDLWIIQMPWYGKPCHPVLNGLGKAGYPSSWMFFSWKIQLKWMILEVALFWETTRLHNIYVVHATHETKLRFKLVRQIINLSNNNIRTIITCWLLQKTQFTIFMVTYNNVWQPQNR